MLPPQTPLLATNWGAVFPTLAAGPEENFLQQEAHFIFGAGALHTPGDERPREVLQTAKLLPHLGATRAPQLAGAARARQADSTDDQ